MVTLTIDEQTFAKLQRRAKASGLTVEEWLKQASSDDESVQVEQNQNQQEESFESWQKRYMEYVHSHEPTGTPLDVSRESIYD